MSNALSIDVARGVRGAGLAMEAALRALTEPYRRALQGAAEAPELRPGSAEPPDVSPALAGIRYPTYEEATGLAPAPDARSAPTRAEVLARPLGVPLPMGLVRRREPLRRLISRVAIAGGVTHRLDAVLAHADTLGEIVGAYARGEYAGTRIGGWLEQLDAYAAEVRRDVERANATCKGLAAMADARPKPPSAELPEVVQPADAAKHLGIDVPAVRKRIRHKQLGAWKRSGRGWYTTRDVLMSYLAGAASGPTARRVSTGSVVGRLARPSGTVTPVSGLTPRS